MVGCTDYVLERENDKYWEFEDKVDLVIDPLK